MKMVSGLLFKMDEKMLCGIHLDKKHGDTLLMARIGEDVYEDELKKAETLPMNFTGRPMRRYIFVTTDGLDMEDDLKYWLQLCIDFNPLAKASPKKKKKSEI
ncbi:RNA methyltransferase [Saprospiraceae bacterium]|nr:RNA methyltransferase [Saprospiraceae bacterium]